MKILHVVSDEKFIAFISRLFDGVAGVINNFVVIVRDKTVPLRFVGDIDRKIVVDASDLRRGEVAPVEHDAVILHYLDMAKIRCVELLKTTAPIMWSGWGGDYYDVLQEFRSEALGPLTRRLNPTGRFAPISRIRRAVTHMRSERAIRRFSSRVDFFSAPIPEDLEVLQSHLRLRAEYRQINYGDVSSTFDIGAVNISGQDILLGNSATATNNHLEAFEILRRLELGDRRIIVPLSYGDDVYRQAIVDKGIEIFGSRIIPVVDFMALPAYNSLISSCSVALMGHRRQQAVGNIAAMLYRGATVILDENATTYQFLIRRGAVIRSLSQLGTQGISVLDGLSAEDKVRNREMVQVFWGDQRVRRNAQDLVDAMRKTASSTRIA